ncbi:MAG: hypothetical protein IH840_01545, partial [Candidatus Heimdallarchaeota archaeon]|nr:hypothetical protein [Candidatus Heimdallarchaeota archaeon]
MFQILRDSSILLIGERISETRVMWVNLYDSSGQIEEEDKRKLMIDLKSYISRIKIKSGSFRKYHDARLLYYEINRIPSEHTRDKIICLYTLETDQPNQIKKALETVAYRGGAFSVYSAGRFFSEMIDLLQNPEKLNLPDVPLESALELVNKIDGQNMSVNQIGQLISLINRSLDMDQETLETLYFIVYERITTLDQITKTQDPDEFLDASYLIARRYMQTESFHFGLELFKKIIPAAIKNNRYDLETVCRIRIASIYKDHFPNSGEYILDLLGPIKTKKHLTETSHPNVEIYYCLLGYAYGDVGKTELSLKNYQKAISFSHESIGSPLWIAEGYSKLAEYSEKGYFFLDASRQYLTAAAIAFAQGNLTIADGYRDKSAYTELLTSYSYIHTAIVNRMEGSEKQAEYRAWEALRILVKAYLHVDPKNLQRIISKSYE